MDEVTLNHLISNRHAAADQDLTGPNPLEPLQVEDELGELDNLVTKTDAPEDEPLSDIFNALQETDEIVTAADRSPAESSPRLTFIEEELQRNAAPISESESKDRTKEKFVTPTLGEIYAAQGQYEKAIDVFEMLSKRHPENEWYQTNCSTSANSSEENSIDRATRVLAPSFVFTLCVSHEKIDPHSYPQIAR
jgi:tetratricopeptide (TPR) repeat protein